MAKKKPAERPKLSMGEIVANPLSALPEVVRAVGLIGVPAVIALFFVWWITNVIPSRLDKMEANTADIARHLQLETEQSWVIQGTLSRICLNTARTDADRMACVTVPKR